MPLPDRLPGPELRGQITPSNPGTATGVAWRDLPAEFGPWQTVWKRHHRFSTDGTWDKVLTALQVRPSPGEIDWRVSVDSTSSRVHQHGATAAQIAGRAQFPHRGQGRVTRIRRIASMNPRITRSAALVAG